MLSACAAPTTRDSVNDPLEGLNRAVHGFNRGFDRAVAGPSAKAYVTILPDPVTTGVSNFSSNLELPSNVVNSILQLRLEDASHNALRFMVNTTIGLGGLFNPAKEFGLEGIDTDFGETLYVWGVGEGPYVELPFFGPYTGRGAVGFVVDFFTSPVLAAANTPRQKNIRYLTYVLDSLKTRADFDAFFNDIYYNSADSYAQARIVFLQNRRFELARSGEETYLDPYDDPYNAASEDTYVDPYEDPYDQ